MDPVVVINTFLDRIRKKHFSAILISGTYLLLSIFISGFLIINIYAWLAKGPQSAIIPLLYILVTFIIGITFRYLIQPALRNFSREHAALLAEKLWPELNNSLINSYQLQEPIRKLYPGVSHAFINLLFQSTERKIETLDMNLIQRNYEAGRNRNRLLAALILLAIAGTFIPNFFTLGYDKLIKPTLLNQTILVNDVPKNKPIINPSLAYSISKIRLKLNYPAYTKLESKLLENTEGKINAFPGTEAEIIAVSNLPLIGADLIVNGRDAFSMKMENGKTLSSAFILRENGYYQFKVKNIKGERILLPTKYPISLKKDLSPKIILFLSNPKPVYLNNDKVQFYYEGHDDFGIKSIDLIFNINGKPHFKRIKTIRGKINEIKNGYTWNLNEMILGPGDKLEYYLEIKDNDNINGPNSGQSEIYSFTIFDSQKELHDLIALQDDLTTLMIDLLGDTLIERRLILGGKLEDPIEIKKSIAISSDRLIHIIQLAQKIYDQSKPIQTFSPTYLTFFKNTQIGLTDIREEQIELIKKLDIVAGKTTPVGLNFPPVESLHRKLIEHLERDILFLVKINNRQKMDQVIDLERELKKLTESLKEEFRNFQNKNKPGSIDEIKERLQKMKSILKKIMDQLAQQIKGLPDEFLNPDSVKQLNLDSFKESLNKIMDMINDGQIDKALKEINKMSEDLQTMANQLNQARDSMDEMMNMELIKKIDKSLTEIKQIEKKQTKILKQTSKINKNIREKQARNLDDTLKEFFEDLKKDVRSAQKLLRGTNEFVNNNNEFKKQESLLDKEARLTMKLQKLRQETIDLVENPNISKKFIEIQKTQRKISELALKKRELQMNTYQDFKDGLSEMTEKYSGLMELAKLFDFREFNNLFKSTYPLAFRWQHKIRIIPRPNDELSSKLSKDMDSLRRINAEISKKLGTMNRKLNNEYDSLTSEQNKKLLEKIAKQQKQLRQQSRKLEEQLSKIGQENPMIDPNLPSKMSSAGRNMESAEKNLNKPDVPKSIQSENGALEKLAETRKMLNQLKNNDRGQSNSQRRSIPKFGTGRARDQQRGGSTRMQKEKIDLPSENQYKGVMKYRVEILEAMKGRYPKNYERFINEYYKELVK